jgi:threonine synthase
MDVGAPSNFERLSSHWTADELRRMILGVTVSDDETRAAIKAVCDEYRYVLDPHGAVGWQALTRLHEGGVLKDGIHTVLATAHPAKFAHIVEPLAGPVKPPPCLEEAMRNTVHSVTIAPEYEALEAVL